MVVTKCVCIDNTKERKEKNESQCRVGTHRYDNDNYGTGSEEYGRGS